MNKKYIYERGGGRHLTTYFEPEHWLASIQCGFCDTSFAGLFAHAMQQQLFS